MISNWHQGGTPNQSFTPVPVIIKRSEIQRMTPNEYRARRDEIRKAVAEERVTDDTAPGYKPNSFIEPISIERKE